MKRNYAEALKWYRIAAEEGHARAQYEIGWMYYRGRGVDKDFTEALKWFHKAAEQGDTSAFHTLGALYYTGYSPRKDGVKVSILAPDLVQALMYLRLSETFGRHQYEDSLNSLERQMTNEQIAEAERRVAEWKPTRCPIARNKFSWNDIVTAKPNAAKELRPGEQAWIVGMSEEKHRSGEFSVRFPAGWVYTIEFEDGTSANASETDLVLQWRYKPK